MGQALRLLTIGQSPRPDMVAELAAVLGERPIEVAGALDGLDADEIAALAPTADADAFHSRTVVAGDVVVSKAAVTERLAQLIEEGGDQPTIVGCTGRFSGLPRSLNVLYPSEVLAHLVETVMPGEGRLGVVVPIPQQIESFTDYWSRPGRPASVVSVHPGTDASAAATELQGSDLVVLDCFGFDDTARAQVRDGSGAPVLSAVRSTAQLAGELLA